MGGNLARPAASGLRARPETSKHTQDGVALSGHWAFGLSEMQGWRTEMEDAQLALPDFDVERQLGLFGVFDGHGGSAVARVAAERLPGTLQALPAFRESRYKDALYEALLQLDAFLNSAASWRDIMRPCKRNGRIRVTCKGTGRMGCTAVVALVCGGDFPKVIVANVGDSRCVLARGGRALSMSYDHKPALRNERRRIYKAGGVVMNGRVDGKINLSRALGDSAYKKNRLLNVTEQKISGEAEICSRSLTKADTHLVLGCDGIFEKVTNQELMDFLLPRVPPRTHLLGQARLLSDACSAFLDANIARDPVDERGSGCDNMTLMLVDIGMDRAGAGDGAAGQGTVGTDAAASAARCRRADPGISFGGEGVNRCTVGRVSKASC